MNRITSDKAHSYTPIKTSARNRIGFSIYSPAGNDTCIVDGIIRDLTERKRTADAIIQEFGNVEQVGFINREGGNPELLMTGGEFCGNATRSAAYHMLNGKPGELMIKVSGVKNKLRAGVTDTGEAFSQIPVYEEASYVMQDGKHPQNMLVHMQGISHYMDFDSDQIKRLTIEEIKKKARLEMFKKGLDKNKACGIIYVEKKEKHWIIYPVVYVRDADTLFFETACGSGTTALGMVFAKMLDRSISNIPILQPSGKTITVSIEFNNKKFRYAQIQSPIEKLHATSIHLEVFSPKHKYLHAFSYHTVNRIFNNPLHK